MLRWPSLTAAVFLWGLVTVRAASGQTLDDKVRIIVWYAEQLAHSSRTPQRPVVFILPKNATEQPATDSLVRRLAPAFERAKLRTVPEYHEPGEDTLLVFIGAPAIERVTASDTIYMLVSHHTYCGPGQGGDATRIAHLRCMGLQCALLTEEETGVGLVCQRRF